MELCQTFIEFARENPVDFFSFHRKGNAEVDSIVEDEAVRTLPLIIGLQTNLSVFNDEGDPKKSWWKPQLWRATVAYPALVARSIIYYSLCTFVCLFVALFF